MVWVNLIMDSFASLAVSTEEPTFGAQAILQNAATGVKEDGQHIIGQSIFQLVVLLIVTFKGMDIFNVPSGLVNDMEDRGEDKTDPTKHMTIVFNTFVWMQLFNVLNCRKIHDETNIFTGITKNKVFLYVCVLQIIMQILIVQTTGRWFNCEPLNAGEWFVCIGLGFISLPLGFTLRCISVKNAPSWMAICREVDVVEKRSVRSVRGQELWIRGFARLRAQLRVVRAFKKGLESRQLLRNDAHATANKGKG